LFPVVKLKNHFDGIYRFLHVWDSLWTPSGKGKYLKKSANKPVIYLFWNPQKQMHRIPFHDYPVWITISYSDHLLKLRLAGEYFTLPDTRICKQVAVKVKLNRPAIPNINILIHGGCNGR